MKKVLWIFLVTLMLAGLALYSCKDELVQELTGSILGRRQLSLLRPGGGQLHGLDQQAGLYSRQPGN